MAGVPHTPGFRIAPFPAALLALVVLLAALPAAADPGDFSEFNPSEKIEDVDPDLRSILATVEQDRLLRITLMSRVRMEGYPYLVRADTLLILSPDGFQEYRRTGLPSGVLAAPVDQIARIQQRRSGAARGGQWGLTAGGLAGGTLGVMLGLVVAGINDNQDSDVNPVLGLGLVGAAMGAAVVGGIGAGIGSLTYSWYSIHPRSGPRESEPLIEPGAPTILDFQVGYAVGKSYGYSLSGLSLQGGFLRRIGGKASLGPAIGYHHLTGTRSFDTADYQGTASFGDPVVTVGLDLKIFAGTGGLHPYLDLGAGAHIASDLYPGAHVGGGLLLAGAGGTSGYLGVRYHFNLHGDFDGGISDFWVIGAGLGLGSGRDE
ncbi:MAG: hypothetical protein AB7V45_02235 [Candidatus Krumholzibacteriia bacterium]